ncbi:FtsK/SpoIIIE domain-containing protein [Pseudoclavibacter soli]|uniref:FtsK/SpoIIIE domain-containing protein n=1 Tax=Pseudoclavibacter soli TaxID=452623 RepID=UPI000417B234|nr:FtsK/SpoIIIE domain-containing protein [Pseudoclavibacter soli]
MPQHALASTYAGSPPTSISRTQGRQMRIPCTLDATGQCRDIVITTDTGTIIGEIADRLRAHLSGTSTRHDQPVQSATPATLCVRLAGHGKPVILDRHRTVGESALQPGCTVTLVDEAAPGVEARRQYPLAAQLVEMSANRSHGLVTGENLIGRDPELRVHLASRDISRRHAKLAITEDGTASLHDLGSANGVLVNGSPITSAPIRDGEVITLGTRRLRFMRIAAPHATNTREALLTPRTPVIPAPAVVPRFTAEQHQLPTPPQRRRSTRLPMLAALVPVLGAVAMYTLTRSPYSLLLAGMAPLALLASWLDNRVVSSREHRRELAAFCSAIDRLEVDLRQSQQREREVRHRASPAATTPLWQRRPEHRTFLEVRFGLGTDLSLTETPSIERAELPDEVWARLVALRDRFATITDVPVVEHLLSAGSIGIVGTTEAAHDALRALIMQIAASHSPADVVLAAFCPSPALPGWQWLKWLPHTASPHSPVVGDHLASTSEDAAALMRRLEEVVGSRSGAKGQLRSHLPADDRPVHHHTQAAAPPEHMPVVIVVVIGSPDLDLARLVHLAEIGPDHSVHLLWLTHRTAELPAACRSWLHIEADLTAALHRVRSASHTPVTKLDRLDAHQAGTLARAMAPMTDAGALMLDESDLPTRIRLSELTDADLGEPAAIARRWAANDSIMSAWHQTRATAASHRSAAPTGLRASVGAGALGAFDIDLRTQGPHAILGGTTGSGKSEFLQTWIMAMAAEHSPDRLTFLLVDYKGGAAFAECADLPHTVGLVTDLDTHLVQRALISLRAELARRERLLNEAGAKDLRSMESRHDARTPPMLVIVVDEFAALAADVPEFVTGIVDIAARGRSLGLHLILATQRPSGVVDDNLRANANLRVALRMADVQDSTDVLGSADAAHFPPEVPGRAAVRAGPGLVQHFQAAYVGAPLLKRREVPDISIADLPFGTGEHWPTPGTTVPVPPTAVREIEAMRDAMCTAADRLGLSRPRRPWLDALPAAISLSPSDAGTDAGLVLGLADDPAHQRQLPYVWSPSACGHLRVIGGAGSGRSQVLRTIVWQLGCRTSALEPTEVYAICASAAPLEMIEVLPIVGSVIEADDRERVERLLRLLATTLQQRLQLLRAARVSNIDQLSNGPPPHIHLLIDDLPALQQRYEFSRGFDVIRTITELCTAGRSVGIHVIFTTDRPSGLPTAIASAVNDTLVLRLPDAALTAMLEVSTEALAQASPGRGIVVGGSCHGLEVQVGLPERAATAAEQAQIFTALAERLRAAEVPSAPSIRRLPDSIPLSSLPEVDEHGAPVFGLADDSLAPLGLPVGEPLLVLGRTQDENATALGVLARAVHTAGPHRRGVLLAPGPTPLAQAIPWHRIATKETAVDAALKELLGAITPELPQRPTLAQFDTTAWLTDDDWLSPATTSAAHAPAHLPQSMQAALTGDDLFVVIERAADFAGATIEPRLAELIAHCRRQGMTCIVDADPAVLPTAWELHGAARTIRSGLLLRPDPDDADRYLRANLPPDDSAHWPPGRGWLVTGGVSRLVQVAR